MQPTNRYRERQTRLLKSYVHAVYKASRSFPNEERYGSADQLRRAALSISLNVVEGYAQGPGKSYRHFLQIAYGSAQESKFLIEFAHEEGWLESDVFDDLYSMLNELSAMIWGTLRHLRNL